MTLGQRISGHRKALGISQEELGARLGVSRQAVSKWETGAAAPDMENLLALAREFGVSVAELTATPEPPDVKEPAKPPDTPAPGGTTAAPDSTPPSRRRGWWIALWGFVLVLLFMVGSLIYLVTRSTAGQVSSIPEPTGSEFYFTWQVPRLDGREWYEHLALGAQEDVFPFGTSLTLTEPEEVVDTDYPLTTLHRADCGALQLEYLHIGSDPETNSESPDQEFITKITTIAPGYTTPMGIGVGDTKEDVLRAYGDNLVYCLKEETGYTLVRHDYYYAYQTPETFGSSLCLYMRDGLVAGICLEDMAEFGCEAFLPNNVTRFPLVDGEPDFSQCQEPEREDRDATQQVYIAWNQLVTNNNLSAEEVYVCRRDVFGLLGDMDWGELAQMGSAEDPSDTLSAFLFWLTDQDSYSLSEMGGLQRGTLAAGLDGAYAESYSHVLSHALFSDPVTFAQALALSGTEDAVKAQAVRHTAYDAELYPGEPETALDTLNEAIDSGTLTEKEQGWAELLRLYLVTPLEERGTLPVLPAELASRS